MNLMNFVFKAVFTVCIFSLSEQATVPVWSLPHWQQVFINHTTWNGHYSYNNTVYSCRLGIHSVNGKIIASLVDRNSHLDLEGYSESDKVIFNKSTVYQASEWFLGSFQLSGTLQWNSNLKYWMYKANATLPVGKPFSSFIFCSTTDSTSIGADKSRTTSIVLGVVLTIAVLGVILMAGSMVYSYRKGLLRHIPLSYRTFKNPKEERRASFDSREETVHM